MKRSPGTRRLFKALDVPWGRARDFMAFIGITQVGNHSSHVLAAALVCWVSLAVTPAAAGRDAVTRVVFTVDVESSDAFPLPKQVNATCAGGTPCGLTEIARQLHNRGWAATFFLNVYERGRWGDEVMQQLATTLQTSGQDVALHTHPDWAYDPARTAMHAYSLEEQTAIVADGVRLLKEWSGKPVVAHRAGAYGADERTLIALERNGIVVDSSVFWRSPGGRLDGLGLSRNQPTSTGHIVEIPVTVYERQDRPAGLGGLFAPVSVIRKIDPDWLINEAEMRDAIDANLNSNVRVLVVFLHSFSFMAEGSRGTPQADRHAMNLFSAMLDYIALKKLPVITMRDIAAKPTLLTASAADDIVPLVPLQIGVAQYFWHRAKVQNRALVGVALTISATLAIGCVWMVTLRMRERQRTRRYRAGTIVSTSRPVNLR